MFRLSSSILQRKHISMATYCSYCRKDRGRHTHRGSHSSSHDSRRRYLSDVEDRGMVLGGEMVTEMKRTKASFQGEPE
jgi:hypothetical protein